MADDLTAALEEIQAEADGSIAYSGAHDCTDTGTSCCAHNTLRLLAALRAVLGEHQPVDRGGGLEPICGTCHKGFWPCPTYLAITREIGGKEEGDE